MTGNRNGLLMAARFAFPPNRLHYCGPEKQSDLDAYIREQVTDPGLTEILRRFETLYPYLVFIAGANGYRNPFAEKVVEAYFLGNSLLSHVKLSDYWRFADEELALPEKLSVRERGLLRDSFAGALPFHTYHVLNVFRRTGHVSRPQTLNTMDECRIGWGTVQSVSSGSVVVMARKLQFKENRLSLSQPETKTLVNSLPEVGIGDTVSFHWSRVCYGLTPVQLTGLSVATRRSLAVFNREYDDNLSGR